MNTGIDKNSYLNSYFALQYPQVDHIITELKKVGRGAHLFKIDVSHAFHHIKVDPVDYDILGLYFGTSLDSSWDANFSTHQQCHQIHCTSFLTLKKVKFQSWKKK